MNRDIQARHKRRMREAGFVRVNLWVHPDLVALIDRTRQLNECRGRVLERLLIGKARARPKFDPSPLPERAVISTALNDATPVSLPNPLEATRPPSSSTIAKYKDRLWTEINGNPTAQAVTDHDPLQGF